MGVAAAPSEVLFQRLFARDQGSGGAATPIELHQTIDPIAVVLQNWATEASPAPCAELELACGLGRAGASDRSWCGSRRRLDRVCASPARTPAALVPGLRRWRGRAPPTRLTTR